MIRTGYIGGSDLADILGLGDYACRLRAWLSKRGVEGEEIASKHIRRGQELESQVLKWYGEEHGLEVLPHPHVIVDGWMGARVDGTFEGPEGPVNVEAKIPSKFTWLKYRREGLPEGYIAQMQWYLGVLGWQVGRYAIFNADSFMFADEGRAPFEVRADAVMFRELKREAFAFWGTVENGPAPDKLEADARPCRSCRYRQHCHGEAATAEIEGSSVFSDDPRLIAGIRQYQEFDEIEKAAAEEKESAKAALRELVSAAKTRTPAGSISLMPGSMRFSMDAVKADNPALHKELEAKYKRQGAEQMRVYPAKEK